jgi:hypothetical protein
LPQKSLDCTLFDLAFTVREFELVGIRLRAARAAFPFKPGSEPALILDAKDRIAPLSAGDVIFAVVLIMPGTDLGLAGLAVGMTTASGLGLPGEFLGIFGVAAADTYSSSHMGVYSMDFSSTARGQIDFFEGEVLCAEC